jgi:hypothetical protein
MNPEAYVGQKINNPVMAVGQFTDHRGHGSHWLGAIRGGFGNPLKTIETQIPVKDVVQDTFQSALRQRGLYSDYDTAKYILNVDVLQYDCNQVGRKESHIKLDVLVANSETKQKVFSRHIVVDNVEGSVLSMKAGIFASVNDLKELARKTLSQAINDIFNNPNFKKLYQKENVSKN